MNKLFYAGIKAAILKDGKVLTLIKNGGYSKFDLPGGRAQEGESFEDTLIRELQEELPGITNIVIGQQVSARDTGWTLPDGGGLLWIIYLVDADLPNPIVLSDEHSSYEWNYYVN